MKASKSKLLADVLKFQSDGVLVIFFWKKEPSLTIVQAHCAIPDSQIRNKKDLIDLCSTIARRIETQSWWNEYHAPPQSVKFVQYSPWKLNMMPFHRVYLWLLDRERSFFFFERKMPKFYIQRSMIFVLSALALDIIFIQASNSVGLCQDASVADERRSLNATPLIQRNPHWIVL